MKKLRVSWTTTETVEWEATIEVADDFDPDSDLHGDTAELLAKESPEGGEMSSFIREVDEWTLVREEV